MRPVTINLGEKFHRLVALSAAGSVRGARMWLCRCDCGTELLVKGSSLLSGNTKSCGCYAREVTARIKYTDGKSQIPEARIWRAMINRCHSPTSPSFWYYGARGITVCDDWRATFAAFYRDMGPRPEGMTLERIDNDRGYEPGNCKWATRYDQMQNTRRTRRVTLRGDPISVREAERCLGLNITTIHNLAKRHAISHQEAVDYHAGMG